MMEASEQEEWKEDFLHVSRWTLWRLRKRADFPKGARVGGQLLFNADEIAPGCKHSATKRGNSQVYQSDKLIEDRLAKARRSMRGIRRHLLSLADDPRVAGLAAAFETLNATLIRMHRGSA
jgi:hypothetical protein